MALASSVRVTISENLKTCVETDDGSVIRNMPPAWINRRKIMELSLIFTIGGNRRAAQNNAAAWPDAKTAEQRRFAG